MIVPFEENFESDCESPPFKVKPFNFEESEAPPSQQEQEKIPTPRRRIQQSSSAPVGRKQSVLVRGVYGNLADIDTDGDGVISREELEKYVEDHRDTMKEKRFLKKGLLGMTGLLILFALVIGISTYFVVEKTKEVRVDGADNALRGGNNNAMVATDSPRVYTTLADIPNLPIVALNSLKQLTFTTIDGRFHNYMVQGVVANTLTAGMVTIFFQSEKQMVIVNGTFKFQEVSLRGEFSEVDVVITTDSSARRLSALREYAATGKEQPHYLGRCSVIHGVCYHTLEEIISLSNHNTPESRQLLEDGTTSIPDGSVTYAMIGADTRVLSLDNLSGLDKANDFLENVLNRTAINLGTTKVSFIMSERCSNYATLMEACQKSPAPDASKTTSDFDDLLKLLSPYTGLEPSNGRWYFSDEIEYSKDANTISLRVRYAHDPMRKRRVHVVLMDRQNPGRTVSYDEVTTSTDPANPYSQLPEPKKFITNYHEAIIDDSSNLVVGNRRLLTKEVDQLFAHHLRATKLKGFPDITFSEDLELFPQTGRTPSRYLQVEEEEDDDESSDSDPTLVEITPHVSTNSYGTYHIEDEATATQDGIPLDFDFMKDTLKDSIQDLPASFPDNSLSDNLSPSDELVAEPLATFDSLIVESVSSMIEWPSKAESIVVPEFETPTIPRDQLSPVTNSPEGSSNRRRLTENKLSKTLAEIQNEFFFLHQESSALSAALEKRSKNDHPQYENVTGSRSRKLVSLPLSKRWSAKIKTMSSRVADMITKLIIEKDIAEEISGDIAQKAAYDPIYGAYKIPIEQLGTQCASFHTQFTTFLKYGLELLELQGKINDKGSIVHAFLEADILGLMEIVLKRFVSFNDRIKPAMKSLGAIPYIGAVFKAFGAALNALATVAKIIAKVLKVVNDFIEKIELEMSLEIILKWNEEIGTEISYVLSQLATYEKPLMVADMACLGEIRTVAETTCQGLLVPMSSANTAISNAKSGISLIESITSVSSTIFNPIYDIGLSAGWIQIQDVITDMSDVFDEIIPIMGKTITVSAPWICFDFATIKVVVKYPCGVKKCKKWGVKYPCGVKYCTARSTTIVPVNPHPCTLTISATVAEILENPGGFPLKSIVDAAMDEFVSIALPAVVSFIAPIFPEVSVIETVMDPMQTLTSITQPLIDIRNSFNLDASLIPSCPATPLIPESTLKVGLIAYYSLDGNFVDSSGQNRHGTPFGTPTVTTDRNGVAGKAYNFVGSLSQYVSLPGVAVSGNGPRTICMWIKTTNGPNMAFLSTGTASTKKAFNLAMMQGPRLGVVGYSYDYSPTTGRVINDGWWHHLAVAFDGQILKTYVDGVLDNSISRVFATTGQDNFLGRLNPGATSYFLTGAIDDVVLFNRALTVSEIGNVMVQFKGADNSLTVGLIAYYSLDGNFVDSSGQGRHGTPFGPPTVTTDRNGVAGKAYNFVGSLSQYVSLPGVAVSGNGPRTICMWIKTTNGPNMAFLSTGTASTKDSFNVVLYSPRLGVMGYSNDFYPTTGRVVNDGIWHHIAVVADGTYVKTYVDGVLDNTASKTYTTTGQNNFLARSNHASSYSYFNGAIDDVVLYNRVLTSNEIQKVMTEFNGALPV